MGGGTTLSDRDRAEARSVTAHGSGHQFEIQLGHLCNNRCVFCSSGQLTQLGLARHIPLDPIVAAIEQARASGARRITFLGGEPTLHKGFIPALARTVELGFEEIVIFTNGVMLPHPGFVDRVCSLGRFEWRISIQGGNEAAHVAVTQRPDSFRRILAGLRLLRERGQDVTVNLCVNERSYRSLPDYPALVREHGIRQLHVDVIRPESAGERSPEYLRSIMPRYSDMAPYFDRMLEEFERTLPGFDVNVGNLPYCILPAWAHRIHHGGEQTVTQSCDERELEVAVDKYAWHGTLRRHLPGCAACTFRPECTGIFTTYLALHGEEEFRPVSSEQLLALDPGRRQFVRYADAWLSPLLEAVARGSAPEGFGWGEVLRDPQRGRVTVRAHAAGEPGAVVTLHFVARERGEPGAVLETDRFTMTLEVDGIVLDEQLAHLVEALRALLEGAPGVTRLRAATGAELHGLLARARLPARGRRRVERLALAVERALPIGPFTTARRCAAPAGVTLRLGGSTLGPEQSIDVELRFAIVNGRLQPSVDFSVGAGLPEEHADGTVARIIEVLRLADRQGGAARRSTTAPGLTAR